jgi:hypothetical protein
VDPDHRGRRGVTGLPPVQADARRERHVRQGRASSPGSWRNATSSTCRSSRRWR